ncbi:hypothetical protein CEP54_004709 [Fusarium duplospermum]|uniref:Clr5 domain-containing protein n=1 Tax=Fusarium duplospermum TaxID=1325734 RepID=A0A428QGT0_9HYPO|nr:hypothetical protein CEP54_004709 [Fusarium duplospermum]
MPPSSHANPSRPSRPTARETPADPVPEEQWNIHKETIQDLYIDQKKRLQDVRDTMERDHRFKASKAQYLKQLRHWGISKNTRRDHHAPPVEDEPGDKRQCTRAAADTDSAPELAAPAVNMNISDFNPVVVSAGNGEPQPNVFPSNFDNMTQGGYVPTTGNGYSGSQSQMAMADPQTLPQEYFDDTSLFQPGHWMDQGGNIPLGASSAPGFNLSNAHYASGPMNIITEGNVQSSQHAHPTPGGGVSSCPVSNKLRQPIHQAAQAGNLRSVKFLLKVAPECAQIKGEGDVTPLWIAAQGGYLNIVELLLSYQVDVQVPIADSLRTPIHQAAQEGHFDVVKRLLEAGADHDPRDKNGISPLWSAAQQGYSRIVKLLLDKGASTETASKDGERRPIHQAAQNGHVEVVRVLLEAKAESNPEEQSFNNETPSPFLLAAQNGNVSIGFLLIKRGANKEFAMGSSKRQPIHQATQSGHADFVRLLIDQKVNVDSREEKGWTPLMIAAQEGYLEIVKDLLGAHVNVNAEEKDGATALWIASQQGHIDVVRKLYESGAKIISVNDSKRRPIHQAAQNGHLDMVKYLVNECGEDVNAEDSQKATPLVLASQGEDDKGVEMMEFLHEKGARAII